MKIQSRTSSWLNWLVMIIVFMDMVAVVVVAVYSAPILGVSKYVGSKFINKAEGAVNKVGGVIGAAKNLVKPNDVNYRLFYVMLRIRHLEKDTVKRFQCPGTLVKKDLVLTALSCFMAPKEIGKSQEKSLRSDLLKIKHVDVLMGEFRYSRSLEKVEVNVAFGNLQTGIAKVKLAVNVVSKDVKPLELCRKSNNLYRTVYIAGLACKHSLERNVVPTKWQEIKMRITPRDENCKNSYEIRKQIKGANTECAVGDEFMLKRGYPYIESDLYDSYDRICEYLGGPVYILDDFGSPKCIVGLVTGVSPSNLDMIYPVRKVKSWVWVLRKKTKKDWLKGVEFEPVKTFYEWATQKELNGQEFLLWKGNNAPSTSNSAF